MRGLQKSPQTAIFLYIFIICALFGVGAHNLVLSSQEKAAKDIAKAYAASIVTLHAFYSSRIAPNPEGDGAGFTHLLNDDSGRLPFPATFTIEFGDTLAQTQPGLFVNMFSDYPFIGRDRPPLDAFERDALTAFEAGAVDEHFALQTIDGVRTARYAAPLLMKQACVDCHNQERFAFDRVWKVGDVRGAREVGVPVSFDSVAATQIYMAAAGLCLLAAAAGIMIVRPTVLRLERAQRRAAGLAAETQNRNRALAQRDIARSRLIADMAHEIRSPIGAVTGFADLLLRSKSSNDDDRRYLEHLNTAARHTLQVADDLMNLSQIDNGRFQLDEDWISADVLFRDAMTLTRAETAASSMRVEIAPSGETLSVFGDKTALRRIVVNLIVNALRHSRGRLLRLEARCADGAVVLSVADDGVGIPHEKLSRVFARDDDVGADGPPSYAGLGIGLALVDGLARLHDATVEIDARDGARIDLRFPPHRSRRRPQAAA